MLDLLFVLLPGRERLIATAQPDDTFLIYRTVPTVLPTNSANPRRGYWFSRTWTRNCSLYSAYFLCRLRQPRGYRFPPASCAGPVPPWLSTPLSHTVLLAGLYTNKSNSFYSKQRATCTACAARAPTADLWLTYRMFPCPPVTPHSPNERT